MKQGKQKNVHKILASIKAALCKPRFSKLLCVILGIGMLAVGMHFWSSIPAAAEELRIPADYGVGHEISKLDNLDPSQEGNNSFNGIICNDKANKIFTLSFDTNNEVNGLVTLARISQNHDLEGYTFRIALGGTIKLLVNYENKVAVSNGSFFGIGNDTHPFKGKIEVGGADDTYIRITGENSWRYLFNNLSNQARIVSNGPYHLCSSADSTEGSSEGSSEGTTESSFVFCRKLTVTEAGALDISGFRFNAIGSGENVATVSGNGPIAVFASEVVSGGANSFSVDLSGSFTDGLFRAESTDSDAGGLFATVSAGIEAEVVLPDSLQCGVKSGGTQKNAGILIGSNNGNVTFTIAGASTNPEKAYSFTGEVNAKGSAGLIGANESNSRVEFSQKIIIDGLKATGLRAGGIAGTGKGPITVKAAEIKNSTFTRIDSDEDGRLGGAIGSVDNENGGLIVSSGGSVQLLNNTFSASKACYIGGYIGSLTTSGGDIDFLTIRNTKITGSGSSDGIGGYIGKLITSGDFSVSFENNTSSFENNTSFTFDKITAGICGGVIGEVNSSDLKNTVLLKGEGDSEASYGTIYCTVKNTSAATVGGLVGKVTRGYIRIDNLSLNNSIERVGYAADLAGIISPNAMLDVGNTTLIEKNGSVLVAKTGQGSVVRLSGNIKDNSSKVYNIVYEQAASLIYKDEHCEYSVGASVYSLNNDIGNYGQVIRNDTLQVLQFDNATHKVSLASPLDSSGEIVVNNVKDFAKLAVTFHTKGAFSGVTGADYAALFGKTVNLKDDISLVDTGIEQLTPSNDITQPFTGTFKGDGQGHTVTLAIGQNILGNNYGVKASSNNKRSWLGLFASLNNATVNNVNIDGKIYLCLPDANQYVGSLAGKADGELSVEKCNVATEITVADGVSRKVNKTSLYVGGMVGYIGNTTGLSVTGCKLGASITDNTINNGSNYYTPDYNKLYYGGLGGYVYYTGTEDINFKNNTISTTAKKDGSYANLKMGGFVGELICKNYVKADLSGTTAVDVIIDAKKATVSAGGILGYSFDKCHIILDGAYKGTVDTGSASLGGLLYSMNGRLTVKESFSVTGTTLTSTGDLRGMLLADGKTALVTVNASPSGFDGVTADGFDLFVGENIEAYTSVGVAASGGIVTVETDAGLGILPQSSGWYTLMNLRQNTKTRYYFNIDELESKTDASSTVNSETDLLYWHVYDYAHVLPDYVKNEFFKTSVNSIYFATADIDMTDYCFYPTEKEAVTVNFRGHKLTFGKPENVNAAYQLFGLQAGLLSDINDGGETTAVNISNIVLSGQVSFLGDGLGSGALICGTVAGSNVNNNRYDIKLVLSDITLNDLSVATDVDYRPMLINRVASYVEASVTGIKQEGYTDRNAASSLIGKGGVLEGSTPSSFIKMTFKNIVLDGDKTTSVFTKATLFYDVLYESGSGSFIYNFNFDEDWGTSLQHQVTYGAELNLNEDQRTYFDNNIYVRPDTRPDENSELYSFHTYYLPYVYTGYGADGRTNQNLSVNRKGADLVEGFGTYCNPYIIRSAKQLEYVSKLLSGNNEPFSDGWQICFPQGQWTSLNALDLTDYYMVSASGEKLYRADDSTVELGRELLVSYLSGAYYMFADDTDLTLSAGYAGLGSVNYPFHGVVHGNGNVVTMTSADTAIGSYGYGFINVANGCAVYDITVRYGTVVLSSDEFADGQAATSKPTADSLSTTLPHFGGAIAWVVGGDNLLERVTVSVAAVTPGACHTVCGGYVGLVSGGGVLLSELTKLTFNDAKHLYHNNYIGRVLEGYALAADNDTYDNGKVLSGYDDSIRSDFVIPTVTVSEIYAHNSGFSNGNTFVLENERDLLLFSFGMNSGAFAGKTGYAYGKTSLSRSGDYSHVGNVNADDVTNGKYIDDNSSKNCILASYFNVLTDIRSTELIVKLSATEYDMSVYKNAFRGMNGVYGNTAVYKIKSFGGAENKVTVNLDMDMLQYAVGLKVDKTDKSYAEADYIRSYGLFGNVNNTTTFQNLNLTGNISVTCINSSNAVMMSNPFAIKELDNGCSVGGFVGRTKGAVTFTNVSLNGITVNSPDICGGFSGRHASGNYTVTYDAANDSLCSYQNTTVKGKRYSGGIAGHIGGGTVSVTGIVADGSVVETRADLKNANDSLFGSAGGIFGQVGSSVSSLTISDCALSKTAVVYTANNKNTGENVGSGGLVGISEKSITVNRCTVDGCVALAVSNFTNGSYVFPDTLKPSSSNVDMPSKDFRNTVVYNGANQQVANIIAWLLEQKANDGSGYSVGAVGGLIGQVRNGSITLTDCTVMSDSAPSVIASFNNAAGLVGEHRGNAYNMTVNNCSVITGGYDMYIVGGPRAAGVVAYRNTTGCPYYKIDGIQIVGTSANPIRILGVRFSTSDVGGIFGDVSTVNFQADNCNVSYCIIGGVRAAGVWGTANFNTNGTVVNLSDIHISKNLIYSKSSNYAGSVFCERRGNKTTVNINGAYVGENYIVGITGAGGLTGKLISGDVLTANYIILNDNVIRKINSVKVSDFTFAASPLTNGAAADVLYNTANTVVTNNVGLIAGNNEGTVTAIAVSCSAPDAGDTKQKNFGNGSGTGTVVYAAYGAEIPYNLRDLTPQGAIEEMKYSALIDGGISPLYGDSVTDGTPQTISALKWWPNKDDSFTLGDTALTKLGGLVADVTYNAELPLFCLNEKTDATVRGYLNMLTGGGFGAALDAGSSVGVTVESKRYSVGADGAFTDLGTDGSVVFRDGKFMAGVYDSLEGDSKTLTVLSINYNDVYTMHLAIYYHRSVNLKTFVVPLEGEQYYLPSFLNFDEEPSGSLRTNVSFGSPFTLYVEYNYNDIAMTLENIEYFDKQIELTQSNGVSDENAHIESKTEFILIDLNSETPAGYSYYTLVLSKDERFINFSSFTNGDSGFVHVPLTELQTLAYLSDNRICKDTNDCVYTEKYLLVVFPVQNNTDSAITYNMKAVINEEERQKTNVAVKRQKEVYGQVSVWGSPTVTQGAYYLDNLTEFSNLPDKPLKMQVNTTVSFANGYVTSLQSQNSTVYGTHILRLRNQSNQYVEIPMGTAVRVETANGTVVYEKDLTDTASQIRLPVEDLLEKGITDDQVNTDYRITLDFSNVAQNDFNTAFAYSGESIYTLVDSFYLSADNRLLGSVQGEASKDYSVKIDTGVKMSVVPTDNRHLGINLLKQEDQTNSGKIDFSVIAKFDAFAGKTFEKASISFSVSKKVYDNGEYKYVELQETDPIKWQILKENSVIESDELDVTDMECNGTYLLEVDVNQNYNESDLTNYRLNVKLVATAEDNTEVTANDYFVFLLCELETEPPS